MGNPFQKNQSVCVHKTDIHNGVSEWVGIQYVYTDLCVLSVGLQSDNFAK